MVRKVTEWPSHRGPITKIMPSDGCKGDAVPLALGQWYNFHEVGCHLGNVGFIPSRVATVYTRSTSLRRAAQPRSSFRRAASIAGHKAKIKQSQEMRQEATTM